MKLMKMECLDKHIYKLEFEELWQDRRLTIQVQFNEYFRLKSVYTDMAQDFGDVVGGVFIKGEPAEFPFNPKEKLVSIPLHIPHPLGRQLFKTCMDFYIEESLAPIHTSYAHHPGYQLLVLTYDSSIEGLAETVNQLIMNIRGAIQSAKTEQEILETEEQTSDDDLLIDEVDEDVVVEFDFEEEIKQAMKEPVSNQIQSIGGGMGSD